MRFHGNRLPKKPPMGISGGSVCSSGSDNEVWSFTPEVYEICKKYLALREKLKPYIAVQMLEAHENGTPVMRPLFYDFPDDPVAWETEDEYLFGPDYLVAPILYEGQQEREVYLPSGAKWINMWTKENFDGGKRINVAAPLEIIPVFIKVSLS